MVHSDCTSIKENFPVPVFRVSWIDAEVVGLVMQR